MEDRSWWFAIVDTWSWLGRRHADGQRSGSNQPTSLGHCGGRHASGGRFGALGPGWLASRGSAATPHSDFRTYFPQACQDGAQGILAMPCYLRYVVFCLQMGCFTCTQVCQRRTTSLCWNRIAQAMFRYLQTCLRARCQAPWQRICLNVLRRWTPRL